MQGQSTTSPDRVALYTRVSTTEQGLAGYSLPHQRATLEAFAATQGWEVVGHWSDMESGKHGDRVGYQAMLAAVKSWDTILVWRIDRLTRDEADYHDLLKRLRKADKRLKSATEPTYDIYGDPILTGLTGTLSARDSWVIGERVRPVMLKLATEGRHVSRAPFGYRMRPKQVILDHADRVIAIEPPRLVIDEDAAALYREAVRRVLAGESVRAIVRDWNARGIQPTRTADQWCHSTMTRLLRNPLHCGLVRWRGLGELVKGQHEALVSVADWQMVQERITLAGQAWSHVTSREPSFLLTGYGRCACGAALVTHHSGAVTYCACRARRQGQRCDVPGMVRAETVEAAVRWVLAPLLSGDMAALLRHYKGAAVIDYGAAEQAAERARARLTADRDRAERSIAGFIDALGAGDISREEYHAARGRAVAARDEAEASLAALPPAPIRPTTDPEQTARLLGALGAVYDATSIDAKRELLTLLGITITREADGVWVRVAPAWRPWTRGDTFFPLVGRGRRDGAPGRLLVQSGDDGKPYAPERTLGQAAD